MRVKPLLFGAMISLAQADIATQYNDFAKMYADTFEENNQDSISAYFKMLSIPLDGLRVLDLGCGDGYDLSVIAEKGALIYGVDAAQEMLDIARRRNPTAELKEGLFNQIPFPDTFFDVVISKWAFQTAAHIDPIYKEVARVLKNDGRFVFLTGHPIRQFIEKKRKGKNYFNKEVVESVFFDGQITVKEPSHTLNEYFSPLFFTHFSLDSYDEGYDRGAEKVDGDIYPSYFIVKATKKNMQLDPDTLFVDFYRGGTKNLSGVTLEEIWAYSDREMEAHHDFIQWLFPEWNNRGVNPKGPMITVENHKVVMEDPIIRKNMLRSLNKMLSYYGFQCHNGSIEKGPNFATHSKNTSGHNCLRITRILKSLSAFGFTKEATAFYHALKDANIQPSTCATYWKSATLAKEDGA